MGKSRAGAAEAGRGKELKCRSRVRAGVRWERLLGALGEGWAWKLGQQGTPGKGGAGGEERGRASGAKRHWPHKGKASGSAAGGLQSSVCQPCQSAGETSVCLSNTDGKHQLACSREQPLPAVAGLQQRKGQKAFALRRVCLRQPRQWEEESV